MTCPTCGTGNAPGNRLCQNCGLQLPDPGSITQPLAAPPPYQGLRWLLPIIIGGLLALCVGCVALALFASPVDDSGGEPDSQAETGGRTHRPARTAAPTPELAVRPSDQLYAVVSVADGDTIRLRIRGEGRDRPADRPGHLGDQGSALAGGVFR